MKCTRLVRMGWFICLALLSLSVQAAWAEDREPDELKTWLEISAEAKLFSKTHATFTQNLRWDDMFGQLYLFAPEFSVRYKLKSWWRIEGGYRYKYQRDNNGLFQHRHRIFANTRFRARTALTAMELRFQWQEDFRHELDDGSSKRHILRTRGKIKYRGWDYFKPYASVELYHRLDGNDEDIAAGSMTKLRASLGTGWGKGAMQFKAFYLLVVPIHDETDPLQHVIGMGIQFH